MTESPVSADLDNSLSSYDASNNDLSSYESYDLSDSSESYVSWQSYDLSGNCNYYNSYGNSYSLECFDNHVSCESFDSIESCDSNIYCGSVELLDSCDSYVSCGSVELLDSCDSYVSCGLSDSFDICKLINYSNSYRPFGLDKLSQINVELNNDVNDVGEFAPIEVVDNDVISTNYNGYSKEVDIDSIENLDNFNIFVSASAPKSLTRKVIGLNDDAIISEVTSDVEASESYLFGIDVGSQKDNLDELNHDGAVLAGVTIGLSIICDAGEPVFDGILISSGYISENEVYFGAISDSDWNILFESVGAENLYLFACLTEDWNSDLAFDILKDVTLHEKFDKFEIDGYKFTKALLKYCISTNEIIIGLESDSEDEHGHVINDTNSHGLDYAYIKHVNVIYKDMPNLLVLTSSGCEKQSTEGSWDALNDILGSGVSSETLLPDHKAIWTPLLLLTQQDLKESSEESHADDNGNNILNNSKNRGAGKKCMCDNKCLCLKYNCSEFNCSCHKHHHHGGGHHHHRHWGHNGYNPGYYQVAATSIVTNDLIKNDNSTDDKNKSSNVTATNGEKKSISSPKATPKGEEPTYTLVYAIIGIVLISLLFNSSYMKRD